MAPITELPDDVIFIILENEILNMEDIENFMSTCKRFRQITLPNKFWEKRYYRRYFNAPKNNSRKKSKKFFNHINTTQIVYFFQKLQYYITKMSENMLNDTDKKELKNSLRSIAENSMIYYFVLNEMDRFSVEKCELFSNLTFEYSFQLIYSCLKQYRFIYKQVKFMNLPREKLLLEKQLTIIAKCFHPLVSYSGLDTWLNNITQTVLSLLKNKHPNHSICSTASEQFSFWRENSIDETFWNETESKEIMCVLQEYIYSELEFHDLRELLMTFDLKAGYVKDFTEYFQAFLLAVAHNIVARRLGICSSLKHKKINIEVEWSPSFRNTKNMNNCKRFYVSTCPPEPLSRIDRYIAMGFIRCPNRSYRSELHIDNTHLNYILITDFPCIELTRDIMTHFFYKFEYNHKNRYKKNFRLMNFLWQYFLTEDIITKDTNIETEYTKIIRPIQVKSNTVKESANYQISNIPANYWIQNVEFAVGMIVRHLHRFDSDKRYGVIIGWHHKYDKTFLRDLYKTNIFTCHCSATNEVYRTDGFEDFFDSNRKHYIILTDNNDICYVHQSQLRMRYPKQINNEEIGKYFSSFEGTYYVRKT